MYSLNESIVEDASLESFGELGYPAAEPGHFKESREEIPKKVLWVGTLSLTKTNLAFGRDTSPHGLLATETTGNPASPLELNQRVNTGSLGRIKIVDGLPGLDI